eukprot:TRINITY_DN4166_c0_g1_i1.p1 TRINITY_DN4166_c0_g1~~TRINITY_DN4166_c0_g1_i1.p1  ORF type:complete len:345 (+),score=115.83 TRINITY_DN4166_c0_g1_i1:1285-2319(+)
MKLEEREDSLSVLAFNLLAPCYYRTGHGKVESSDVLSWKKRHSLIIEMLSSFTSLSPSRSIKPQPKDSPSNSESESLQNSDQKARNEGEKVDIFCFQEFWFEESFLSLYQNLFKDNNYAQESLRRPGGIEDGVAIFYNANRFKKLGSKVLLKDEVGNRVGLLLHLEENYTKSEGERGEEIVVIVTHLTFPHNHYDEQILRVKQIKEIVRNAQIYIKESASNVPVIICGDMNSPYHKKDPVYQYITEELGFQSTFKNVNGREPGCTHFNHKHEEAAVDYIFVSNPKDKIMESPSNPSFSHSELKAKESFVIPKNISDAVWPSKEDFSLSDHRPLLTRFKFSKSTS